MSWVFVPGWVDTPERHAVAATLPTFAAVGPRSAQGVGENTNILLYRAFADATGAYWPYERQQIGDCFPAGTMVRLRGGRDVRIEGVRAGDLVDVPRVGGCKVTAVMSRRYTGELVNVSTEPSGVSLTATAGHRFALADSDPAGGFRWRPAGDLARGDEVVMGDWFGSPVERVRRFGVTDLRVYDIEVEGAHRFLANGYLVHNCVSHGHGHGNDLLQCVEWTLQGGPRGGFKRADAETDTEALYGMAREAGNMLGDADGCYGSAAVKAMTTMGVVPRSAVGPYSGQRAKEWGRTGAPADVKEKASRFKLGSAALVKTWDELVRALGNGYPVTICTGLGFAMERDADGFCRPQGRWGHCWLLCAVRQDRRPGACGFQSWGPGVPSGPLALDQPDNTFWMDRAPVEQILAEGDSWALSRAPFFTERPVPSHWKYGDLSGF